MNTRFRLSVSVISYPDKNTTPWDSVNYRQQELTIDKFVELIKQGYCFCHCFKSSGEILIQKEKTKANFTETQMVFVDIDNFEISMNDFVNKLSKKPTVAYTTRNNLTEYSKWLYRFRLCYLFDTPITSDEEYTNTYQAILQSIRKDIPTLKKEEDTHLKSSAQQIAGNALPNIDLIQIDSIYSKTDFPFENNNVSSFFFYKSETEKPIRKPKEIVISDKVFISDVNNLNSTDLIRKYKGLYPYFDRTKLNFKDGYALLPDDYQEIYRSWYRDTLEKTNGDIINLTQIKKHRDGDRRRKKLFIAGLIMKKILPTITFEHLLFNLICERTWHYDNSDGVLTNSVLSDIAKNVINIPVEEIRLQSRHKKKFIIDKAYCVEHGISPNKMKNIVRKKLKDEEIGNLYDVSLSLSENLSNFKQMGMKIGKTKLYAWCLEHNISTKGHNFIDSTFGFLSKFSKSHISVIEKIIGTTHRYFIADLTHEKEIGKSQYYELRKAIPEIAYPIR